VLTDDTNCIQYSMINKVVVHYVDGRIEKGYTSDFQPQKEMFHLVIDEEGREKSKPVKIDDLKAVFFVKELKGKYQDVPETKKTFEDEEFKDKKLVGKKIKIVFTDGEVLYGITFGYSQQRRGFFFNPLNPESNNERIFAVWSAVKDMKIL
jgi:FMN phosphatase YigB (HAD superfamily)